MKTKWLILFLSPLFMTGCLWLPTTEPHKQTVQKGTPPPVDPNLPGSKAKEGAKAAVAAEYNTSRPIAAPTNGAAPITADQVNQNNAHEKGKGLFEEIELDRQNLANPSSNQANLPWPK